MDNNDKVDTVMATNTEEFIIKVILIAIILIISILVTLIVFKIAIQKKLIFKLSHYL
jgi:hypothetical protein